MQTPWLTQLFKTKRLEWAQEHVRFADSQWKKTIFPMKMTFLAGSNGLFSTGMI